MNPRNSCGGTLDASSLSRADNHVPLSRIKVLSGVSRKFVIAWHTVNVPSRDVSFCERNRFVESHYRNKMRSTSNEH